MKMSCVLAAALLAAMTAIPASAADAVKIGAIYPLTGNAASAGASAKDAVELAVGIVNNAHPELPGLPLAATAGLPNLGGAKIELVNVDHQGSPQVGQNQTLRLITQDKVVAVLPFLRCAGRHRGRGTPGHSLPGRRFGCAQHHRPRLQMDLPQRTYRVGLRRCLYAVSRRSEESRPQD